jgi:rod shape determining protein RodA
MSFFYRQFIWFGLSIFSLWFAFKVIKLEKIRPYIFMFLIITILLLIAVLIFGENVKGAVRSFRIWKINIQPSLIARIVLILYFAHFLDKKQKIIDDTRPKGFLRHFNALIVMTLIVFLQDPVFHHTSYNLYFIICFNDSFETWSQLSQ